MQHVGYIRVSTHDQNIERQLDGIELDEVFTEYASGKDTERPQLKDCLRYIRKGDVLHVHSIDRLARNLFDLEKLVKDITSRDISIIFHKENLHFVGKDNPMQVFMLQMLGAVAQFERSLIRERQREGIEKAKKRGAYKGKKSIITPALMEKIKDALSKDTNKARVAKGLGISRQTLYKALKQMKES